MIVTEFLTIKQYNEYGTWLKSQDDETRSLYFGVVGGDYIIDGLMDTICSFPDDHYILIAKDKTQWLGTIHIAVSGTTVEFGVIVHKDHRGQGIANQLLEEAILWAQNRGYRELYMHCLGWNKPIKHLCDKHGLHPRNVYGDSEVQIELPYANWVTLNKEIAIKQRNIFHRFLQNSQMLYQEIYG
jgi:GNAT superfamily N-acetyltransferase